MQNRFSFVNPFVSAAALLFALAGTAPAPGQAAPPAESLLPAETKAFFSTPDAEKLRAAWGDTRYGKLAADPALRPLVDKVRRRWTEGGDEFRHLAEMPVEELMSLSEGSFASAIVPHSGGGASAVVFMNIRGDGTAIIERIRGSLRERLVNEQTLAVAGTELTVLDLRLTNGSPPVTAWFISGGWLVLGDDTGVLKSIARRMENPAAEDEDDSLASTAAFRDVFDRCRRQVADRQPHLRWFVDPVGLEQLYPDPELEEGEPTAAEVYTKHGLDAVKAVGAEVHFHTGEHGLLAVVAAYAPGPFAGTMQAFRFPEGRREPPLPWVNDGVDSYSTIYVDLANVMNSIGPLFDELAADGLDGTFEDILADIRDRLNIDVRRDLIPLLGPRVTSIALHSEPAEPGGDRAVYAIETSDPKRTAAIVQRLMEGDGDVVRVTLEGQPFPLWRVRDDPTAILPNLSMTVAHGHLLLATHGDAILQLLSDGGTPLGEAKEFQTVLARMKELGDEGAWLRRYGRLDRELFTLYHLLRSGRAGQSRTPLGRWLAELLGSERDLPRSERVDYSLLPDYDVARRYLGATGMFAKNQPTGWIVVAFDLP